MADYIVRPIARVRSDFQEKFGIPRQAGVVGELTAAVVFEPEYRNPDALRGLEGFSHIWLIWQFSENANKPWSPTVRPPRLGGNKRMGVFATRSPFRPNALGLSCVRLMGMETRPGLGTVLLIAGVDLMDGTPVYDIKPYLPYADCHPEALSGFAPDPGATLAVRFAPGMEEKVPADKRAALTAVLANDPRPRYQDDPARRYAMAFAGLDVAFSVDGETLTVTEINERT
ncbi:MAG: tRNA (N6-threonylcarbamoyladenosine(37)-N6)-methyltransferase TrmO [Oscillospiraceae bacterium]|nr:tRNA (N6-threonylcarbamoyladenosine(37)-N6)-methyltransferase TrmO [Oscillospiraceae bacterium]